MAIRLYENLMTPYGTLTSDATNPATGGTLTIGEKTYTLKTALTEAKASNTVTAATVVDGDKLIIDGITYEFKTALSGEVAATGTITSDATAPGAGGTVTLDDTTYTWVSALTEAYATDTLTSDETEIADGDTVTINDQVYRFKDTMAQANDVKRDGTTADTTLANLVAAINLSGTEGVEYYTGTAAVTDVTAAAVAAHATVLTADTLGAAGNAYAAETTASHLSWGGSGTLEGGADPIVNEVLIDISAAAALDNIKVAVNGDTGEGTKYSTGTVAHTTVEATTNSNTVQTFSALQIGESGNSIPISENSTHLTISAETLLGGTSNAAYEVLLGSNDAEALDNLKLAINEGSNKGVKYSSLTTAHPTVTATTNTNTTQVVEAITPGTEGNSLQASGNGTTLVWATPYLTGGVNPVENEILIGNAAADTLDNVKTTVNGTGQGTTCSTGTQINAQATATTNTDTTQLFTAKRTGVFNDIAFSESATHLSVDGGGTFINKFNAGAATYNQDFKLPEGAKGANFLLDIDSKTGTLTFDCKIQSRDPETGACVDVPGAAFAQKSAAFEGVLSVYPGLTAVANVAVTQALPKNLRAVVVVGGSSTPTANFSLLVEPLY